jgi:chemotaxis protein methyltransferase CheR
MPTRTRPPLLSEASFARIPRQRVVQATGVHLADDRRAVVAARLHKRLKTHRLADFEHYLAPALDSEPGATEHEHLLRLLVARDATSSATPPFQLAGLAG